MKIIMNFKVYKCNSVKKICLNMCVDNSKDLLISKKISRSIYFDGLGKGLDIAYESELFYFNILSH